MSAVHAVAGDTSTATQVSVASAGPHRAVPLPMCSHAAERQARECRLRTVTYPIIIIQDDFGAPAAPSFFLSSSRRGAKRFGGSRLRRPSRERTLT
eukprot:COSAG05_NODE_4449_length_1510_cov_1.419561_2_plen_96_part_00